MIALLAATLALVLSTPLPASSPASPPDRPTVMVAIGAEGEAEYGKEFATWAQRWETAAQQGNANFVLIGRDGASDGDKRHLKRAIETELKPDRAGQPLWLVLIGHGTFDGREAKFNLRGPDVSDEELAAWLAPCKRPLAVIDCSAASAPFLTRLSGPDRVIVTATRSGQENNAARFGDYLSVAMTDPAADLDKDGQTSLLEAFLAASSRTAEFYASDGRILTEHALLDDNGDKLGTGADFFSGLRATRAAQDGAPLDGPRASQWHLVLSAQEQAMPPQRRARRDELELAIETLRQQKAQLAEADYYARLETLLLDLARLYANAPTTAPTVPSPLPSRTQRGTRHQRSPGASPSH